MRVTEKSHSIPEVVVMGIGKLAIFKGYSPHTKLFIYRRHLVSMSINC